MDIINSITAQETVSEDVKLLEQRVKRCVCRYCGSELVLRRISYGNAEEGRIDIFCPSCNRIEYGVEPEIYRVAQYYVDQVGFDYYYDLDDSLRKQRMNMAKVCEMMEWCCKNIGVLGNVGFYSGVKLDNRMNGTDITLSERELR